MEVYLKPGKYVVAVSGGVDSVALLNMLAHKPNLDLIVAHFDHGIREDSLADRKFVEGLAGHYGLPFVYAEGQLGPDASEATARKARYDFLHEVRETQKAQAIVTAHHEDDLLETALLNMLRGTNRKGLSSLRSTDVIKRPLISVSKNSLINYAETRGLEWHEDSTNLDEKHLRNYIRHKLLPQLLAKQRKDLLAILGQIHAVNATIDTLLEEQLKHHVQAGLLDRRWFVDLSHAVAREIMAGWLRQYGVSIDRPMLERVVIASKTKVPGKKMHLNGTLTLTVQKHKLALDTHDR